MTNFSLRPNQADLPSTNPTASYWLQQLSPVLAGQRTTPYLPGVADVVIIGSGMTGAFAAHFLKNSMAPSTSVLMLEAREACSGASGRNGGHCQPIVWSRGPEVAMFELRNYQFLQDLVARHNIPCHWHATPRGGVFALGTPEVFDKVKRALEENSRYPELMGTAELITDKEALRALGLRVETRGERGSAGGEGWGTVYGALVHREAAGLWPYKLVSWVLENLLERYGHETTTVTAEGETRKMQPTFNLQTNTPATYLQYIPEGNSWMVHTPRGQILTPKVLVATNGYLSRLLPGLTGAVRPTPAQVIALEVKPEEDTTTTAAAAAAAEPTPHLDSTYVFIGRESDDYLIQSRGLDTRPWVYGGGRAIADNSDHILVDNSSNSPGASDDSHIDASISAYLRQALPQVLSAANGRLDVQWEWTGIMGYSYDRQPWVGRLPAFFAEPGPFAVPPRDGRHPATGRNRGEVERGLATDTGLWVCGGYTGHGMPNTVLAAKAVVEMMQGRDGEKVDLPQGYRITVDRLMRIPE